MKMQVQEYLEAHGLDALVDEFNIVVTDYPDRVVLNYNQIDSPRFNPICDECRALILKKDTWEVLARSFDRFYNVGEGEAWKDFPVELARFDEKLDGSLLSLYNDGEKWCVSTRKMAFAEGGTNFGLTFRQLFDMAIADTNMKEYLKTQVKGHTYIFELTSPMNRIVTRYHETQVTLIGIRNNKYGFEVGKEGLDRRAFDMGVKRPKAFESDSIEDLQRQAEELNALDEGFVLVVETDDGSFMRLKCKNPKYLAIAHMRNNGNISPQRILVLIVANEYEEYLGYFPEDTKYFDLVADIYNESLFRILDVWNKIKGKESQKDFAISAQQMTKYSHEAGILFSLRKNKRPIQELMKNTNAKRLTKSLQLKEKFAKTFGIESKEEAD